MTKYMHINMLVRRKDNTDMVDGEGHEFLMALFKSAKELATPMDLWVVGGGSKPDEVEVNHD